MGQHFMICEKTLQRIACHMDKRLEGKRLLEIGAGKGALTKILLQMGAHVLAVEKDARLIPFLENMGKQYPQQLFFIHGDVLRIDLTQCCQNVDGVIGNIPYVISAPLIHGLLRANPWPPSYKRMVFVVQKELGERLVAQPGRSAYGRLSVLCWWRCSVRLLEEIPRHVFSPEPAVDSVIVSLQPQAVEHKTLIRPLEACLRALFRFPRKTLRNNWPSSLPLRWLEEAGGDPHQRPSTLEPEVFLHLAQKGGQSWERESKSL